MKIVLPFLCLTLLASGCATDNLAEAIKAGGDNASIWRITNPNTSITRIGPTTNSVTIAPDGTILVNPAVK